MYISGMSKKLTKEDFVERSTHKHGYTYDYSSVNYVNTKTKVAIKCPIHGEFWQRPETHMKGAGCEKCGKGVVDRPNLWFLPTPRASKAVPLTQGKYALVDEEDYERVSNILWNFNKNRGYAQAYISGVFIRMHRFLLKAEGDLYVDHINGNKLDNRRCNLRLCDNKQNSRNRGVGAKGVSKYKGVCWDKNRNKWISQIRVDYQHIHLGRFDDEEEAAKAYDEAAKKYHKDFARLNFPNGAEAMTCAPCYYKKLSI